MSSMRVARWPRHMHEQHARQQKDSHNSVVTLQQFGYEVQSVMQQLGYLVSDQRLVSAAYRRLLSRNTSE